MQISTFFYFLTFEKADCSTFALLVGQSVGWLTSPLFFFNVYRHKSPSLTQYHFIPISTKLYLPNTTKYYPVPSAPYWPSTTKYQPVPPCTDAVSSNINQFHPILTQYYQVPTSTTKYQPLLPNTDPVPPSTNQYCPVLTQYNHISTSITLHWPSTTKY